MKAAVPVDSLLEEAYKIAERATAYSPVAIVFTRQMMDRNTAQPNPQEAHKIESLAMLYAGINDGREGVEAFPERQGADFILTEMPDFFPWQE